MDHVAARKVVGLWRRMNLEEASGREEDHIDSGSSAEGALDSEATRCSSMEVLRPAVVQEDQMRACQEEGTFQILLGGEDHAGPEGAAGVLEHYRDEEVVAGEQLVGLPCTASLRAQVCLAGTV